MGNKKESVKNSYVKINENYITDKIKTDQSFIIINKSTSNQ